jgi:hypothetical protein
MSKGPGRVERRIAVLIEEERDNAFTLEELCERVYAGVNRIEKKHRISVARAARSLAKRRSEFQCWRSERRGGPLVFLRHDEVMSYAMARLKTDKFNYYGDPAAHPSNRSDEDDLRESLRTRDAHLVAPVSGAWWRFVQMFLAERDGDGERLAQLKGAANVDMARVMASFGKAAA